MSETLKRYNSNLAYYMSLGMLVVGIVMINSGYKNQSNPD